MAVTSLAFIGLAQAEQALCSGPSCLLEQALASVETSGQQSTGLDKMREAVATSYAVLGRSNGPARFCLSKKHTYA